MAKPQEKQQVTAQVERSAPEPAASPERAPIDMWRVKGPGGLFVDGRSYVAGDIVQMSEGDALSVLDHIEPA